MVCVGDVSLLSDQVREDWGEERNWPCVVAELSAFLMLLRNVSWVQLTAYTERRRRSKALTEMNSDSYTHSSLSRIY